MSDIKLSALPAAAAAADADKLVGLQSGVVVNQTASALKTYMHAAPGAIGGTTPSTGAFTTISASGQITSTLADGTAPLVVTSTTNIPNLNASTLSGKTFAVPAAIGSTTPAAGTFTALTANTSAALTSPTFAAGSATAGSWPIFTPGSTLLTAAVPGAVEVDANCFYATTDAGNRGVVDVVHFIRQHADRAAFANNTNQQAIFDSVANGTLTLETGWYVYDALIMMSGMSATSGNIKWSLLGAGGATLAAIVQYLWGQDLAVNTNGTTSGIGLITEISSAANAFTGSTATVCTFHAEGSFEVTVAGSIIPSAAQSAASTTAVTVAGSYFRVRRMGASGVLSVGQWT